MFYEIKMIKQRTILYRYAIYFYLFNPQCPGAISKSCTCKNAKTETLLENKCSSILLGFLLIIYMLCICF